MDILKTIANANALMQQGTTESAEKVLDKAIIEARGLIAEIAELRAYKEAAEMQEPTHIIDWEFDDDPDDVDARGDLIIHQLNGAEYPAGTPLYAKSVPAKCVDAQESMVWLANALEQYTKGEVITVPSGTETEEEFFMWLKNQGRDSGASPADKPERITEQDAMAILLEWDAYRAERSASGVTPAHFKKWLNLAGRDLLNKLNADREQVPAVAVPDRELLRAIVDKAWNEATDSECVPSTKWADRIIDSVISAAPSRSQHSAEPSHDSEQGG